MSLADPSLRLVIFTGLPGTGKSSPADALARAIKVPAFAGDWLLGALKPAHEVLAALDRPTYVALYHNLMESLVVRQLMLGQSAIADCGINDTIATRWRALADQHQAQIHIFECFCSDESEHRRRIEGQMRGIPGWHEIGWDHVQRVRHETSPLTVRCVKLDGMNVFADNLDKVQRLIR